MKRPFVSDSSLSLGIRVAVVMSLGVLVGVLLTAGLLEFRARGEARAEALENLRRARTVAADRLDRDGESLSRLAATISHDPTFFSLLTMNPSQRTPSFRHTLAGIVREFQRDAASEIFDVTDIIGTTLAASDRPAAPEANRSTSALVREALSGRSVQGYRVEGGRLYRVAVAPVSEPGGKVVGTLTIGSPIDDAFAGRVRAASGADLILVVNAAPSGPGRERAIPRPALSTLTDAGTRSVLATIASPTRDPKRWTARDAQQVSIAKLPGLAIDVPLSGLVEGGSPRLLALTPIAPGPGVTAARETLLAAGAVSALLALFVGWNMGGRVGRRLRLLSHAAHEARQGNYDVPLPQAGRDEEGILVAEFDAMRGAQRLEVERLLEVDRMKTDFLSVTAEEIAAPAQGIDAAVRSLASAAKGAQRPETVQHLRSIHRHARDLSRLASDLGSLSVVSRFGAPEPPPADDVSAPAVEAEPKAAIEVMAEDGEAFTPVVPMTGEARPPVDIAALLEGVAAEQILDAARRGIEFDLAVDPELVHPGLPPGRLEADVREYVAEALGSSPAGTTLVLEARRQEDTIEVSLRGGPQPLHLRLPLPVQAD